MATFDPTRLFSTLLNTGLQVKDNALYQVIHDLIAALATINKQTNSLASSSGSSSITNIIQQLTEITDFGFEDFQIPNINSSVTNVVNNVNNTIQQISGDSSSDFSALDDFQIPGPIGPPGPIVPYHIGINETFFVPLYKQALFAMNIDNEGTIEVEGFLIEVESPPSLGTWTPTDQSGASLSFIGPYGNYIKIGKLIWVTYNVKYPVTASGASAKIGGLPFTVDSIAFSSLAPGFTTSSLNLTHYVREGSTNIELYLNTGAAVTNAQLSGAFVEAAGVYQSA